MKCKNCSACVEKTYAESFDIDFYCLCGVTDNERLEKSDGSLGCDLHYTKVKQKVNQDNEMSNNERLRFGY